MSRPADAGRNARHIALASLGSGGQARIEAGSVFVVGAGGIGCAALAYLAAAGVGRVVITDFDSVDATNLGRQILYGPADVGRNKVEVAAERLRAQNPQVSIETVAGRLSGEELVSFVAAADVVVDGSDNFATRFAVNEAAVASARPLVSGAAIRFEGQVAVFGPDFSDTACYRCLYSEADESLENCAGNGVFGPVPGMVGTLIAAETLKILSGLGAERGVLRLFDAIGGDLKRVSIPKRPDCPVCA